MKKNDTIDRLARYDFRDSNGIPLINCLDFQLLVEEFYENQEKRRELERELCKKFANG